MSEGKIAKVKSFIRMKLLQSQTGRRYTWKEIGNLLWEYTKTYPVNIVVALVLIAIVAMIIRSLVRGKKSGKSSCGGNCSGCAGCGHGSGSCNK